MHDHFGIPWEYEPVKFDCLLNNHLHYPDFLLAELGVILEFCAVTLLPTAPMERPGQQCT